jgi:hypothetical protein
MLGLSSIEIVHEGENLIFFPFMNALEEAFDLEIRGGMGIRKKNHLSPNQAINKTDKTIIIKMHLEMEYAGCGPKDESVPRK